MGVDQPFKTTMPTGMRGLSINGKNAPGFEKFKTPLGKTWNNRSTIPTSRYKKLSGENVLCAPYI